MVSTRGSAKKNEAPLPPRSPASKKPPKKKAAATPKSSAKKKAAPSSASSIARQFKQDYKETVEDSAASSDDPEEEDDSESGVDVDVPAKSIASNSSAGSRRSKIALTIEKQLIADIEGLGGIDRFDAGKYKSLSKDILDRDDRVGVYPEAGTAERRAVQKRVQYWKNNFNAYHQQRELFNIPTAKTSVRQKRLLLQPEDSKPEDSKPEDSKPPAKVGTSKAFHQEEDEVSDLEDTSVASVSVASSKKSKKPAPVAKSIPQQPPVVAHPLPAVTETETATMSGKLFV